MTFSEASSTLFISSKASSNRPNVQIDKVEIRETTAKKQIEFGVILRPLENPKIFGRGCLFFFDLCGTAEKNFSGFQADGLYI